jgi:uncharacterized protein YndB with AHSA1/START domain
MLQERESPVRHRNEQANEFVIQRVFNTPRNLVWKAFSEPDRLARWWGPVGFKMIVSKLEFSPGGTFHYRMQSDDGFVMWGKFVYLQIIEPEKIVFIISFSDENGSIARVPLSATWPLEVFIVLTLTEKDGDTKLTLKSSPINSSEKEIKTFRSEFESMNKGFSSSFDQLEEYLSKL